MTGENVVVTALALIPGLVIGWLATRLFLASFSTDLLQFDAHIRPASYAVTGLAIVAVLLSQWPALRTLARLDIAATMRERAA